MKADERRALVVRAALVEFGQRGYEATSTVAIADRVGVSQPYLFRLFKTKRKLFEETAEWALLELCRLFREVGRECATHSAGEFAEAFAKPSAARRDLMRFELALCAAAGDPGFAEVARRHFASLWTEAARAAGAPEHELQEFFAGLSLMIVRSLLDE
ncbi:helix-turn-helix domain-containing protein [Streptomyces sp. V4-01]|uniref:Helix-turn-helix domain-containing protein n=1 Tax=Actinacidiphila polyblastidii TaxID=3110430 RepID=A0ABU7PFQ0_9ACTN|nr:helix-turn-helix domain-containing protein [Streptomyces sp. V4-01]